MFKILLLGLNFLNIFNYQIVISEEVKYEEIIYQDEVYIIYVEENSIKLKTRNDEWIRVLDIVGQIDAFVVDRNIYIFYYDNGVFKSIIYSRDGKVISENVIFDNVIENYKVKYNEGFYIVGSVGRLTDELFTDILRDELDLKNGFIVKLDKDLNVVAKRLYGGELNDEFFDICFSEEYIYVAGKKDVLSSGDFGNGGKNNGDIFLAKLSRDLELINYLIFNDVNKVINLNYFKDYLYLTSSKYIYKIDSELTLFYSNVNSENAIYSKLASFNKLIVIAENQIFIYDIFTFEKLLTLENKEVKEVREFKDILYIRADKYYYFDIACMEGIKYLNPYTSMVMPILDVETIYGQATYIEDVGQIVFDPLVYGNYLREFKFRNNFGLEFIIKRNSEVQFQANVSEGGVYPLGYNLKFTGRAYLNGVSIANNYSISDAGEYSLKLLGINNEEKVISFYVDSKQINFNEEALNDYDNVIQCGGVYYISIKYQNDLDDIKSVIIDGKEYFDILIKKDTKVISVKMNAPLDEGIMFHIINGIYYKKVKGEEKEEHYLSVDLVYVVNVVKEVMDVSVIQTSNFEYLVSLDDANTARYFLLTYYYNNQEYVYKYPLSSNKLLLENVPKGSINVFLQIYYDLGDKSYRKIDLMEFEFNNLNSNELIEIDVLKKEESLQEFKLNVVNEKVQKIRVNSINIYEKTDKDYSIHYLIGVILLGIFLSIIYKIRLNHYGKKEVY